MIVKMFELRDRATFIPVICIEMTQENLRDQESWLLRKAGYDDLSRCILLVRAEGGKANYDPYAWGDRTFTIAHDYISKFWEILTPGEVIDVSFILKETTEKKVSERFE